MVQRSYPSEIREFRLYRTLPPAISDIASSFGAKRCVRVYHFPIRQAVFQDLVAISDTCRTATKTINRTHQITKTSHGAKRGVLHTMSAMIKDEVILMPRRSRHRAYLPALKSSSPMFVFIQLSYVLFLDFIILKPKCYQVRQVFDISVRTQATQATNTT